MLNAFLILTFAVATAIANSPPVARDSGFCPVINLTNAPLTAITPNSNSPNSTTPQRQCHYKDLACTYFIAHKATGAPDGIKPGCPVSIGSASAPQHCPFMNNAKAPVLTAAQTAGNTTTCTYPNEADACVYSVNTLLSNGPSSCPPSLEPEVHATAAFASPN
ncbi:hypothetical protein C8R47DRAFT_1229650 [Mycena vitilis]|nr:hypothetical protein C8R47DRAFT_1229650 [Mycena vitilis]